jgi:hypothetical protein
MSLTSHLPLDQEETRHPIIVTMVAMSALGLNRGTAGNVSVRSVSGMLTGIEPERLAPKGHVPV